jgi:hypothetical protein
MYQQPRLSDEEWDLIAELIECERNELPVEIYQARSEGMRKDLRHRADVVRRLHDRLRQLESVAV